MEYIIPIIAAVPEPFNKILNMLTLAFMVVFVVLGTIIICYLIYRILFKIKRPVYVEKRGMKDRLIEATRR